MQAVWIDSPKTCYSHNGQELGELLIGASLSQLSITLTLSPYPHTKGYATILVSVHLNTSSGALINYVGLDTYLSNAVSYAL